MSLDILKLGQIPPEESELLDNFIRENRNQIIRSSEILVKSKIEENPEIAESIKNKDVSKAIFDLRELVWVEFLKDEFKFNSYVIKKLPQFIKTPMDVLDDLLEKDLIITDKNQLKQEIKEICGEYSGLVYPYVYKISLSNTQSRRSRAGTTFEAIIYSIYEMLGYPFDSQRKIGSKVFHQEGLGKKVDSVLPGIEAFQSRRNKSIIGTMKTSLRERWQEVAEEIERTKIPEIHLLTADENIPSSKAQEMSKHNITVVAYNWISNEGKLKGAKSIISFEEYFFKEIPQILEYWYN